MKETISPSRPWIGLLAICILVPAAAAADEKAAEDLHVAQRGGGGGWNLDHLVNLTAASMMQVGPPAEAAAPNPLLTGWSFGGFLETAYQFNFNQPAGTALEVDTDGNGTLDANDGKENNFRIFDVEHNDFSIHHLQLGISKAATDELPIGLEVKAMVGQDAKFIHSAGLNVGDDFDLMDAYMTFKIPADAPFFHNAVIDVGKWETMFGAEVISATGNSNYSRSYLFGFAIPFTHTGVRYSQTLIYRPESTDEMVGIMLSLANGWDNVKDNNQGKAYMGEIRFAPCKYVFLNSHACFGNEQANDDHDRRFLIDFVSGLDLKELPEDAGPACLRGLSFLLNYDYGAEEFTDPGEGSYSRWYGFAGIVKYDLAPVFPSDEVLRKFYFAFRGEFFDDPEGVRTGTADRTGNPGGNFVGLTTTVAYQPWSNFLLRLEHRYDKANHNVFEDHNDVDENHQNTLAIDAILTF